MQKRHLDARKSQPYFALPIQIIYFRAPKLRKKIGTQHKIGPQLKFNLRVVMTCYKDVMSINNDMFC